MLMNGLLQESRIIQDLGFTTEPTDWANRVNIGLQS